jgi:hypothetical protein
MEAMIRGRGTTFLFGSILVNSVVIVCFGHVLPNRGQLVGHDEPKRIGIGLPILSVSFTSYSYSILS